MFRLNSIRTIFIEGNIAVGKSTLLSRIESNYSKDLVRIHQEPIDSWTNTNGFDLLGALYNESCRWSFAFEMKALASRIRFHHQTERSLVNVFERSILSCFHVFIRNGHAQNHLNDCEYEILRKYFEFGFEKTIDLSKTLILYFDLPASLSLERIRKRARPSESSIDLKRLETLKVYYDDFIQNLRFCSVKTIDASQSFERINEQVDAILQQIVGDQNSDENFVFRKNHGHCI